MSVRDDVLRFLRDPTAFAVSATDPDIWLAGLEAFAKPSILTLNDRALRPAQEAAWRGLADRRTGLVLGPPGTGKTHLLSWLIAGYGVARAQAGETATTFVTAFTKNAAANVLEAVAKRQALHAPDAPAPIYYGAPPDSGLPPGVEGLRRGQEKELLEALATGRATVGGTIWSLYRLLGGGAGEMTAPLFSMVCIDEASQMVLGQGLLALAGLAAGGRVVVAGDDQQLPPVRSARSTVVGGHELGGSLYAFLKSADAAEFPLEETFRLNAPLASFPERKFYPGRYVSAEPDQRLRLTPGWAEGLDLVTRAALDPAFPVVVLVHDAAAAATANPFEANLAAKVALALSTRLLDADASLPSQAAFWSEHLAIVSPHRAQNAEIRAALPEALRADAFVETVDRIQGKERDAIVLSYCVSDPEFALAEADFIFSSERLNVAVTRARTKLVLLISRNLLEAAPTEQEVMDKAEILREFVFSCAEVAELEVDGPTGRRVTVQVRARGFPDEAAAIDLTPDIRVAETLPEMTPQMDAVLAAVRQVVTQGEYDSAALYAVQKALALPAEPFEAARALHQLGWISLQQRPGPRGAFWVARPYDAPRRVYAADLETVRTRIEVVVREAKSGRHAFYDTVRDRFAWMTPRGADAFLPVLQQLAVEGLITLPMTANGAMTVALMSGQREAPSPVEPEPGLSDEDFALLNQLEGMEARRINFGVFDAWTSAVDLGRAAGRADASLEALSRLQRAGHLLLADDGRVRSRMAELARELRYVKQRFRSDDAAKRPYLVRNLKLELRDRRKPDRSLRLEAVFDSVAAAATPDQGRALDGLRTALRARWGDSASLAAFQQRGLAAGLSAWRGEGATTLAIAADTGSGKTEAAVLPMIAGALADRMAGVRGVRAVLAYPRIRLAANQAQRLAAYLAACQQVPDLPLLTLGLQVGDVPDRFDGMHPAYQEAWRSVSADSFVFPFFACPNCKATLRLQAGGGADGADALICSQGDWRFDGWIGSKAQLQERPPALFLPTTDSLHQWLHDPRYGRLFGDDAGFAPPRAMLADEIHLYTHIHGAQVGYPMRRPAARARPNRAGGQPLVAVGMSATMGEPGRAWGRLIGREAVEVIQPETAEADLNPRGREYFYFIQPEVESRGSDIAGASTTIQSLMCLGHGMRRRTGDAGGYRALVFFDSIDRMRRLHGAYLDAEEGKELAAFRTVAFGDDAFGQPQTACCGNPVGCDRYLDGECWWFAANDRAQWGAAGLRSPGDPLKVARSPIYSGTSSEAEALVQGSDVVFATSSLEVGYDDPDIGLVYQHYAPQNLASFVQRKGRGGRNADDRPLTAITLSLYSPRDSWWFRKPHEMVSPQGYETPVNPGNAFVRRGQALSTLLDGLSRWRRRGGDADRPLDAPSAAAFESAAPLVEAVLGDGVWPSFGVADAAGFWAAAQRSRRREPIKFLGDLRRTLPWAPNLLFDTVNLPAVAVAGPDVVGGDREDISYALPTVAPGNATRRYNASVVHWRPPQAGRAPWLAPSDYAAAERSNLADDSDALLEVLPLECRAELADVLPQLCRPVTVTLERVGWIAGAHWTAEQGYNLARTPPLAPLAEGDLPVSHDSRSNLRGFLIVEADPGVARSLTLGPLAPALAAVHGHAGEGIADAPPGLTATQVYWGADADVRLDERGAEPVAFTQTFTDPQTGRPLLHGYAVQTEGIRFAVDSDRLSALVAARLALHETDAGERHWREAQFGRFLLESGARNLGVNGYAARRGAELLVAIESDAELRAQLTRLLKFWSPKGLGDLFEAARVKRLGQHPLLTPTRVAEAAEALAAPEVRTLLTKTRETVRQPEAMAGYLRSTVLHGLTIRLRRLVGHVGQSEDSRLLAHVRLPIQFESETDDVITICEAGAHGDGTIRAAIEGWGGLQALWSQRFLSACPNAAEDAVRERFWREASRHDPWRALDPRDPQVLAAISAELAPDGEAASAGPLPASLVRVLFGSEAIEGEAFSLYDLAAELETVRRDSDAALGRSVLDWELASAAVSAAESGAAPELCRLQQAYGNLAETGDGSLSPDARLAEQAFRLAAPLCVDGCRGCVHQPSDLMGGALAEASVSRRLLTCFEV